MDVFIQRIMASRPTRKEYVDIQLENIVYTPIGPPIPIPMFISKCDKTKFNFKSAKLAQLTVERGKDLTLDIGKTIGSMEFIRTVDSKCTVTLPSIEDSIVSGTTTIDYCENLKFYIPLKLAKGIQIFTTNSAKITIRIYEEDNNGSNASLESEPYINNEDTSSSTTNLNNSNELNIVSEYVIPFDSNIPNVLDLPKERSNTRFRTTFDEGSNQWATVKSNLYGDEIEDNQITSSNEPSR